MTLRHSADGSLVFAGAGLSRYAGPLSVEGGRINQNRRDVRR
jgi:hypothetical protein